MITVDKTRLLWTLYHGERSPISFMNSTEMPLNIVEKTDLKNACPIGVKLEDKRFNLVAGRTYFSIDYAELKCARFIWHD